MHLNEEFVNKETKGVQHDCSGLNPRPANIVKYNIPKFMKNSESNTNW